MIRQFFAKLTIAIMLVFARILAIPEKIDLRYVTYFEYYGFTFYRNPVLKHPVIIPTRHIIRSNPV